MARERDPHKLSSPQVYLWRMIVFLVITGFVVAVLFPQIAGAFMANPGLNGLIIFVLLIGIALSIRQVTRLFREISWVNDFRLADPGLEVEKPPVLLAEEGDTSTEDRYELAGGMVVAVPSASPIQPPAAETAIADASSAEESQPPTLSPTGEVVLGGAAAAIPVRRPGTAGETTDTPSDQGN